MSNEEKMAEAVAAPTTADPTTASTSTTTAVAADDVDDEEEDDEEDLEKLQAEIARMEAEAARISKETDAMDSSNNNKGDNATDDAAKQQQDAATAAAKDKCSIYVGQVDYAATPEALLSHFEACGTVERVTIVCDKFTGKPKGFAYLEFEVNMVLLHFSSN